MFKYFVKSYRKFKEDALAKLFYDFLKWLIPLILLFIFSKIFSKGTSFEAFLSKKIIFSLYSLLLFICLLSAILIIVIFIFYRKYQALLADVLTDKQTGLKNGEALKNHINDLLKYNKSNPTIFSIIIIDIDDFKKLNTDLGHADADNILSLCGMTLGNDKRITDETFRLYPTGDEFAIVTNETTIFDANKAAERKRKLLEKMNFNINGTIQNITVCCGVTEYKKGKDDFDSLINRASQALAEAKKQTGKNNTKMLV